MTLGFSTPRSLAFARDDNLALSFRRSAFACHPERSEGSGLRPSASTPRSFVAGNAPQDDKEPRSFGRSAGLGMTKKGHHPEGVSFRILFPRVELHDLQHQVHRLLHGGDGNELVLSVGVVPAGEEVRRRQPAVAELGSVGAPPDGDDLRLDAELPHGLKSRVHDVHLGLDLLQHVVVLVGHVQLRGSFPVPAVQGRHCILHGFLSRLERLRRVVPDDVVHGSGLHIPGKAQEVEEPFVFLGCRRSFVGREHGGQLQAQEDGVHHLVLGLAGMDAPSVDRHPGPGGVEGLVAYLPHFPAVHGVGEIGAELLQVQQARPVADLLVGGEGNLHAAVDELRMGRHVLQGRHDLGDSRLVIGAEEGRPVGDHQGLAPVFQQVGEGGGRERHPLLFVEDDVAAVVVFHQPGTDRVVGDLQGRVQVSVEGDDGDLFIGVGREGGRDVGVLVHSHVGKAQGPKFLSKLNGKGHLPRRAGDGIFAEGGLGGYLYVLQKAVKN
ncbi:hypothetical protein SDC9_44108 [bioreactor metagenome]|uniref:Uncharacterized protein n=1 Tax=bioreactor metagenome TaxID=1076179 RepID=A0A644W5E6_9ZZZZ